MVSVSFKLRYPLITFNLDGNITVSWHVNALISLSANVPLSILEENTTSLNILTTSREHVGPGNELEFLRDKHFVMVACQRYKGLRYQ